VLGLLTSNRLKSVGNVKAGERVGIVGGRRDSKVFTIEWNVKLIELD
jgi:hypothetical protein